ncbi:hypothetical protein J2853_007517 [Streptosporangium lutulentum]|uniref:Uncharacterized protein n=1 Tax=Streptosporangium lutulentum TaxID=1461250 RepID=A0ABT9QNH2_9ACTN|nr:hypothetical protein [Streptosporangium lutulentum]
MTKDPEGCPGFFLSTYQGSHGVSASKIRLFATSSWPSTHFA